MNEIIRISLRNWDKNTENSKDFYYPLLAYECSVAEITNEGDAIQEAVLKLLALNANGADFAARSIGNVLGGLHEDIVQQALDSLKYKGLIDKKNHQNWQLLVPLDRALSLLFDPTPNQEEQVGYMFYNPIRKNILPYFYVGNLFKSRYVNPSIPELYFENKTTTFAVPKELVDGINSEWDTQYAAFFHVNGKIARKRERAEEKVVDQMPEIPLEEMGGYEEDEEDAAPGFDAEKPVVYVDGEKALVKPFKKSPTPVFVRMRIVYDSSEIMCGYKVESPFPLDNADGFGANIDYIRFNDSIAKKFTFREQGQTIPLIEYLEAQAKTKFPNFDFEGPKQQLENRMAMRWPRIAALRHNILPAQEAKYKEFVAYFKDIAALEDNPPQEWLHKDLHAFTDLVDHGLEDWMHQIIEDVAEKAKRQDSKLVEKIEKDKKAFANTSKYQKKESVLSDWKRSWADVQSSYGLQQTNSEINNLLTQFLGVVSRKESDIIKIFENNFESALREFNYSSRGNSIVHKLINIMWLQFKYHYSTNSSRRLLKKEGLADFIRTIDGMQHARVAGDHREKNYIEGETERDREKHCKYIIENFYKVAERILDALEEK